MTQKQQSERATWVAKLRETLKPGDILHTVLRSVSRTGTSRVIDVYKFEADSTAPGGVRTLWLSYWIAHACGMTFRWRVTFTGSRLQAQNKPGKPDGIVIAGYGMDMGFQVVYELGRTLWPDGFATQCISCGRYPTTKDDIDAGQPERAPQCGRGHQFRGRNGDTTGWDNDGGYALTQEWL